MRKGNFMNSLQLNLGLVLTAASLAMGCNATPAGNEYRREANKSAAQAQQAERQTTDTGKEAIESRMNELERRLAALRADAKPQTEAAQRELDKKVDDLRAQIAELRAKLATEQGRADAWERFKKNAEEVLNKMEKQVNKLG